MDPAFEPGHETDETGGPATTPDELSPERLDTLFGVLADSTRRHVMRYLVDAETTVPLDDIAEHVAETTSTSEQRTVKVELHHRHLPRLAEEGIVSYDAEAHLVAATTTGQSLDALRATLLARGC